MPLRQDNTITRRMKQAMFAGEAEARRVVNSARRQQGLHQVYRDFCRSDGGCARCVVYLAHRAGRGLPVG
jgi:ferredoxin